jgi:hypothetical protein
MVKVNILALFFAVRYSKRNKRYLVPLGQINRQRRKDNRYEQQQKTGLDICGISPYLSISKVHLFFLGMLSQSDKKPSILKYNQVIQSLSARFK